MIPPPESVLVVEQSLPRERLDAYLRSRFPEVSRGTIQRLLAQGAILVEGRRVKATHHPRAGERIAVRWPEPVAAEAKPQALPLDILFEDEHLLVLNKPPGRVVHPAAGHAEGTLVNALLHHCAGQLSGVGGVARPGIVHRLDKETSGCLVVAKDDPTHLDLSAQFAGRAVEKIYHAIVCGHVTPATGELRASIGRHPTQRQRMAVVTRGGRDAWTSYRLLEPLREASLVEARLHTGRTHQVRVHFQQLGFPLVGDSVYGSRAGRRLAELTHYTAPRQMLHAFRLAFRHPQRGDRLECEAPWPEDFRSAVTALVP